MSSKDNNLSLRTMKLRQVTFHIGNTQHNVSTQDVTPETSLNTYLREVVNLVGSKRMCLEGGCGTCIVVIEDKQKGRIFAVNSCLVSIFSCHGWRIHTIEGLDDGHNGPHPIQKVLAEFNGSQCGFCSPGMVMNMFALYQNGNLTMQEVEDSFGGNICRCTGYRSILTGFKSLCVDASYELLGIYPDIEDIHKCLPNKCNITCPKQSKISKPKLEFELPKSKWVKVYRISDIFEALRTTTYTLYMLIAGNTGQGVYRPTVTPDLYIDVTEVPDLISVEIVNNSLIVGANYTLANTIQLFQKLAGQNSKFSYLQKMADHISLVANNPVRNIGTLAGNLMVKHGHHEFQSDIFLMFETVGAIMTIAGEDGAEVRMTPAQFIVTDMNRRVIVHITLPELDENCLYKSYKIMPRAQNVKAHVNAGFLFELDGGIVKSASIVYGAINPEFVHAQRAEESLVGKPLFDNVTLQRTFSILEKELKANVNLPEPPPEFRRQLAIALLYRFVLSIAPDQYVTLTNRSGRTVLTRGLSSGVQDYKTNKSLYPLTQPIPKLEALAQTTGTARYIDDQADLPNQLYASFVAARVPANSTVTGIDLTKALATQGVTAFFGKNDIPGQNTFTPNLVVPEELFCSGRVQYFNQPIGIVVANSREVANNAARLVNVAYTKGNPPMLNVEQVLQANARDRITVYRRLEPKSRGNDVRKIIRGQYRMGWQYQYHMEVQCCQVVPTEDGIDMYPATQWMDLSQFAAAAVLKIPANRINIQVRRLGGAFGAKISRNAQLSCAAALAAYKLKKPVKMWMNFDDNMDMIGKRDPIYCEYEVGVNANGVIQYLNLSTYTDYGVGGNDPSVMFVYDLITGNYNTSTWNLAVFTVTTDNAGASWARAPGSVQALGVIESIMDHIACELNLDPIQVRIGNIDQQQNPSVYNMLLDIRVWADVDKRTLEVNQFNRENRWKKKGISVTIMTFSLNIDRLYTTLVSVFHDGSVGVIHGGVEMGQGINTKVAQVVAYKLGISLDMVQVKPSYNNCTPNCGTTGGSLTSEAVCYGALRACDQILDRIKPFRNQLNNPTWEQLITVCYTNDIQLLGTGEYSRNARDLQNYLIYGACVSEVEVDILTGQHLVRRVDIVEDVGESMSPLIDIGQVEGAFIMGQGYYTTENTIYNSEGQLLTNRTWTYWPPGAKDIPLDLRVKFPNKPNPAGVLNSKATAEPPMCLSCSIPIGIRHAVASARTDASINNPTERWIMFDGPTTIEYTFLNSLNKYEEYTL